jgi:DNA-binding SARP family transcriptional activator/pimeloyl-ACP methyl ester carboxylesterase
VGVLASAAPMEFRLLGPLEVVDGAAPRRISAGKQRALLAILLLNANKTVSRDRIVADLWGENAPASARKMVQIHVSQLRKALPGLRLRTRAPGYALEVADGEIDLERFERLVAAGRAAFAAGDAAEAAAVLGRALALWRGPALDEFSEPFAGHEAARLEEQRVAALEARLDADLAAGRQGDLVGELETLVAEYPLRERFREQLMLALVRSGRQAEALAAYRSYRRTLLDELGIVPSRSLADLERRILQRDPTLDAAAGSAVPPPEPGRRDALRPPDLRTRYAKSGDVSIAYQVVGDGPLDLVLVHGWVCTFDPGWENPSIAHFYRRLAQLGRLVLFDKRGTGLSDRVSPDRLPDLETRMDDVRAVLDAVDSQRAVLVGISEGGPMSVLYAATYPERTAALVLIGAFARALWAPDYTIGVKREEFERAKTPDDHPDWLEAMVRGWLGVTAPEAAADPETLQWYVSYVARGASPAAVHAIGDMNFEIDVRHVLPTIRVPTLALHRSHESNREVTRYMAERIPGSRLVELPGTAHLPWEGDADALVAEVDRFLGDVDGDPGADCVLSTLLVAETAEGVRATVVGLVARFRGRLVETDAGSTLALFDGPARAVRCAAAIVEEADRVGLEARAGLHSGEIAHVDGGARGLAVDLARQVAASASPGEVLVSSTLKDILAGSRLAFEERRPVHGLRTYALAA